MFKLIIRILKISGEDRKSLILSICFSFLESMTIFTPYMLVFYSVHRYISNQLSMKDIYWVAGIMLISIVLRAIFRRTIDGLQSAKGLSIFSRKRIDFVNHLRKLPMGYFSEDNIGNIISILTTDLIFAEEIAMTFFGQLINSYISLALSIVVMLLINVRVALVYGVVLFVAFLAVKYLDIINKKHGKIRQDQFATLSNAVIEFIKGIPTIKAFGLTDKEDKIIDVFDETTKKALAFEKQYLLPRLLTDSSYTIGTGVMIFSALLLYFYGHLSMEMTLGMLIFSSVSLHSIVVIITGIPRFGIFEAGLNRYDEVMDQTPLVDVQNSTEIENHDIEFKNVTFAYEKKDIIKGMSFQIKENTLTALVGPSGSGKSTITNLISRFWDVDKGEVLIGGKNIKEISLEQLLSSISMVFQNVYLFKDTIFNNIAFGMNDATKEQVIQAAKRARCHDFIMQLPKGYDTMIGEGGATLSGGEKQRVSIARAILKDAPIILLDEATSSVDPENEVFIQEAINELIRDKTLIVIAHRLSSIKEADNIFIIEDGQIVEKGNHDQLIKSNGVYREMYSYYVQ